MSSSSEIADRWRRIAAGFTARVEAVPPDAWERPAPCEGWVARDVVRHLVEWMPGMFLEGRSLVGPTVDDDPAGAWRALDSAVQTALDDPSASSRELDVRIGTFSLAQAVDTFGTPDVLMHTWDLARATGLDETLDAEEVHRFVEGMEPLDDLLRQSGHYGPRVAVAADADEQTRLLAFLGRTP